MQCSAMQSRGSSAVQYIAVHCKSSICYTVKFNELWELNCCALKLHIFLSIELHCTTFLWSALHWKVLKIYIVLMQSNSIHLTDWTSLYSKFLICSALQFTGLHCSPYSAQHCTALDKVLKSLGSMKKCIRILQCFSKNHF